MANPRSNKTKGMIAPKN